MKNFYSKIPRVIRLLAFYLIGCIIILFVGLFAAQNQLQTIAERARTMAENIDISNITNEPISSGGATRALIYDANGVRLLYQVPNGNQYRMRRR